MRRSLGPDLIQGHVHLDQGRKSTDNPERPASSTASGCRDLWAPRAVDLQFNRALAGAFRQTPSHFDEIAAFHLARAHYPPATLVTASGTVHPKHGALAKYTQIYTRHHTRQPPIPSRAFTWKGPPFPEKKGAHTGF
jgi:hypothetical protein